MPKLRNLLIAALFVTAASAGAQTPQEPVRFTVSPETPAPHTQVTIFIEGVGSFLGDAEISWTQDGVVAKKGPGERTFTTTIGALGTRTTVGATIVSATQGTIRRTFTLAPSVVTMLWEADTTVPPLFRGKPLYSAGSPLTIVALPTVYYGSSRVAPSALSYQWSRNDEPMPEASGLGRSSLQFMGDQLQSAEAVAVDVYYGAGKVAHGETLVPAAEPKVVLYQYNALRGSIYDAALPSAISLSANEIAIKAEPYYFSNASKKNNALSFTWQIDSQDTTGPDAAKGILTLRQAGEGAGQATLTASLQNYDSSSFVQTGEALLQIVFGQAPSSALGDLFGL